MFTLAIFGANSVDGSAMYPGEQIFGLALFGGLEFDFIEFPPPPGAELTIVSIFGGAKVKVRQVADVTFTGLSLFGARRIDSARGPQSESRREAGEEIPPPLDIAAYSLFGGVHVQRCY
jgi:hypothetical protein